MKRPVFLALLLVAAVPLAGVAQPAADNLKDGEHVEIVRSNCLACHDDSYITSARFERSEWDELLDVMVGMGMEPLDDDTRGKVLDYLETAQGPDSGEAESGGSSALAPDWPWGQPLYPPNPVDWSRPAGAAASGPGR